MGPRSPSANARTHPMKRVMVVGTTCAGKTTLAARMSKLLHLPHVEFDGLFWGPNWTYLSDAQTRRKLAESTAGREWILDGNCLEIKDVVWPRADTLVWLDYPLPVALWRAVKRTCRRCASQEVLWGTNVENWRRTFFSRDSLPLWAIKSWRLRRRDYSRICASHASDHLRIYRLRSPKEANAWLANLAANFTSEIDHPRPPLPVAA